MNILSTAAVGICSLVLLVWTSRHFLLNAYRRRDEALTEDTAVEASSQPLISVVLAAKDEEGNIERCVRTMLAQDYPNFEFIVANDRSNDRTGEILDRLQQEDPRLRALHIQELPEGWCGKNNAMQQAIKISQGEWLCMLDADCWQTSQRTLSLAISYAQQHQSDLLSMLPTLNMQGFWENVVQPVSGGVMMIWFQPDKVNDPSKPQAYANGAFMLMRRSAYERIGTHEAVKEHVNEDVAMAKAVKEAGLRLRVVRNRGLYLVRMYESFGAIVRGWTRIFYGSFGSFRRLAASLLVMLIMGVLPYVTIGLGVGAMAAGGSAGGVAWSCALVGLVAVAMQLSVIHRFYRLIDARPELAWTYPIGCAIVMYALVRAMLKLRSGARIVWRNSVCPGGSREIPAS